MFYIVLSYKAISSLWWRNYTFGKRGTSIFVRQIYENLTKDILKKEILVAHFFLSESVVACLRASQHALSNCPILFSCAIFVDNFADLLSRRIFLGARGGWLLGGKSQLRFRLRRRRIARRTFLYDHRLSHRIDDVTIWMRLQVQSQSSFIACYTVRFHVNVLSTSQIEFAIALPVHATLQGLFCTFPARALTIRLSGLNLGSF